MTIATSTPPVVILSHFLSHPCLKYQPRSVRCYPLWGARVDLGCHKTYLGPSGLQALPPPPREGWPRLQSTFQPQGPPREAAGLFFRRWRKKVGEGCSPVGRSRRWAGLTSCVTSRLNEVKRPAHPWWSTGGTCKLA